MREKFGYRPTGPSLLLLLEKEYGTSCFARYGRSVPNFGPLYHFRLFSSLFARFFIYLFHVI